MLPENKATVLVIGDHGCGKTTFLKRFCNESPDQKINKCSSKINIYLKRQNIERTYTSTGQSSSLKYVIEFIEICGEKPYKDAMSFYVSRLFLLCSAIFFFFDLTNKKSLYNFYMWIKFLMEAWDDTNMEHPLWNKPFLICAGKSNLIGNMENMKGEVEDYFRTLFGCPLGMNIIYLGKGEKKKMNLYEMFLDSFLEHLCLEKERNKVLKKKEEFKEEPDDDMLLMELSLMLGMNLNRFHLNKDAILKNLFVNTFARETVANLYWQFINQLWGYYKSTVKFFSKVEEKTRMIKVL